MLSCFRTPAALSPPRLCWNTTTSRKPKLLVKANMQHLQVQATPGSTDHAAWRSLGTPQCQLLLHNTLPTGQSFRWRLTAPPDTYTGVIGQRVVQLRQLLDDVQWRVLARGPGASSDTDAAAVREYFNLDGADLAALYSEWCSRDARFSAVSPHLPGARMLRQDPVECLFEFICSSNNHISRIHGMVERLCTAYGSELLPSSSTASSSGNSSCSSLQPKQQQQQRGMQELGAVLSTPQKQQQLGGSQPPDVSSAAGMPPSLRTLAAVDASAGLPFGAAADGTAAIAAAASGGEQDSGFPSLAAGPAQQQQQQQLAFYAFPTLQQLSAATEEALRADGFGYRAKFIVGSVQQLLSKPGGGEAWLLGLRARPYAEAHEALCSLPGVGPKVAACICLFSLDKHDAIPVDTHVWDLATRYYAPQLAKKTLNKQLHADIQQVFVQRFGPYAGWAHNTLFISELASHRHLLPAGLGTAAAAAAGSSKGKGKASKKSSKGASGKNRTAAAAVEGSSAGGQAGELEMAAAAAAGQAVAARRSSRSRRRTKRYSGSDDAADSDASSQ